MPMGLPTVIPNAVIEASWGNAVADRVVGRFANAAERDAAITAPTNGMLVYQADSGLWLRDGGAWVNLGGVRRRGVIVSHTGQAINSGAAAQLAWTVESFDSDSFHATSSPSIVVPAGLAGVYSVACNCTAASAVNGMADVTIITPGQNYTNIIPVAKTNVAVSTIRELAAGDTVALQIFNGHNAALFFAGSLRMFRLAP